jgi:hypothetical protein
VNTGDADQLTHQILSAGETAVCCAPEATTEPVPPPRQAAAEDPSGDALGSDPGAPLPVGTLAPVRRPQSASCSKRGRFNIG